MCARMMVWSSFEFKQSDSLTQFFVYLHDNCSFEQLKKCKSGWRSNVFFFYWWATISPCGKRCCGLQWNTSAPKQPIHTSREETFYLEESYSVKKVHIIYLQISMLKLILNHYFKTLTFPLLFKRNSMNNYCWYKPLHMYTYKIFDGSYPHSAEVIEQQNL